MKLFLASDGIKESTRPAFLALLSKPVEEISFAYISNAADPYPPEKRKWMENVHKEFVETGLKPAAVDLRAYTLDTLLSELEKFDVIWCGGGNTWYLRYLMKKSGFDAVIKTLLDRGVLYGGDSAGAIVMSPTLRYVDLIDDPGEAPERIEEGLGAVDFAIVPHWGTEGYQDELTKMRVGLQSEGYEVKVLTDQQAIVVDGNVIKLV